MGLSDILDFTGEHADPGTVYKQQAKFTDLYKFNPGDRSKLTEDGDLDVLDEHWVNGSFSVTEEETPDWLKKYRNEYLVTVKFTDTALGGNIAINMPYGYTRYADVRPIKIDPKTGQVKSHSAAPRNIVTRGGLEYNIGMGPYYSDAIDDSAQLAYFQFGVAKKNGLLSFIANAIDYQDVIVANRGYPSKMYTLGRVVGAVGAFLAFPWLTTLIFLGKTALKIAGFFGTLDYYYLDLAMPLYYGMCNDIGSRFAVESGILLPTFMEDEASAVAKKAIGIPVKIHKEYMDQIRKLMPNIISEHNYIDVFAIVTRAQAISNMCRDIEAQREKDAKESGYDMVDSWAKGVEIDFSDGLMRDVVTTVNRGKTFETYLENQRKDGRLGENAESLESAEVEYNAKVQEKTKEAGKETRVRSIDGGYKFTDVLEGPQEDTYYDKMVKAFDSGLRDGGEFMVLKIETVNNVTTTFNNSVKDIGVQGMLNQVGKAARDFKFNVGGGGDLPDFVQDMMNGAMDFARGVADSFSFGLTNVIDTLMGNAFVNIPKTWDDSSTNLPGLQFNFKLRTPYGDAFNRFQALYLPLSMMLAGMLPKATGQASYTSPFLCSCFCKGVRYIKLGMITDLSITSGVGTVGYTRQMEPLAFDVSMTVTDLSPMITVPVATSIFDKFTFHTDDNTPFSRFISSLTGRSMFDNRYLTPKVKIKLSMLANEVQKFVSPHQLGFIGGSFMNSIMGGFVSSTSLLKDR